MTRSQTREQTREKNEADDWDATPLLLRLPAEIRIVIWELVVVKQAPIDVDPAMKPPGLLAVNRQIRNETIHAYYSLNRFMLTVVDLDAEPIIPFLEVFKRYDRRSTFSREKVERKNVTIVFDIVRGYNWANFKAWVKAVFMGRMSGFSEVVEVGDDRDFRAIRGVFGVVWGMIDAGVTWEQAEQTLPGLRTMLGARNKQWLKDWDD